MFHKGREVLAAPGDEEVHKMVKFHIMRGKNYGTNDTKNQTGLTITISWRGATWLFCLGTFSPKICAIGVPLSPQKLGNFAS